MIRRVRSARFHLLLVLVFAGGGLRRADAAFDMTGRWEVALIWVATGQPVETVVWDVTQTGTSVTVTPEAPCPMYDPACASFEGTINPGTGVADVIWHITFAADGLTFMSSYQTIGINFCDEYVCEHSGFPFNECCTVPVSLALAGGRLGCGNGVLDPGEICDDGNAINDDGCDNNCTPTGCGNGVVTAGETCDDGNVSDADACKNDCTPNVCGDGVVRVGVEQCDDANSVNDDGCDNNCTVTGCGNGIVTTGEACDNGAANSNAAADACRTNCSLPRCGDGVTDTGEQCDDGNANDGDQCKNDCTLNVCGDGVVRIGVEDCDDGNTVSGDGCSALCMREFIPGGGAAATDCLHEWVTNPIPAEHHSKFSDVPAPRIECIDDQQGCDLGSVQGDHACTFLVAMCFNVADPALQCTANSVGTVQVLQPRAGGRDPVAAANRVALESALGAIGGQVQGVCRSRRGVAAACTTDADCDSNPGSGDGVCLRLVSFGAGLSTPNACTPFTSIRVPVGRGRFGKLRLHLRAQTSGVASTRQQDNDTLTLICRRRE